MEAVKCGRKVICCLCCGWIAQKSSVGGAEKMKRHLSACVIDFEGDRHFIFEGHKRQTKLAPLPSNNVIREVEVINTAPESS